VQAHFSTHHPSEILVNETFKREAWEVLKQLHKNAGTSNASK
jgi:uracil-DNA glycosylase